MPKVVLIVEDSETCVETLEIAFETIPDLICRSARNTTEALAYLAGTEQPSALVTDLNLKKGSGFDLIRNVRADIRYSAMPILLISGDSDPDLATKAMAAGASAFFAKPYSPAAVRRTLKGFLCP